MPEIGGLAVLIRLVERVITIPRIMMVGYGDLTTAVKAMKLGAVDFLEKPHKESELVAAVEHALDLGARNRLQRGNRANMMSDLSGWVAS